MWATTCFRCKKDLTDHPERYVDEFGTSNCWQCIARQNFRDYEKAEIKVRNLDKKVSEAEFLCNALMTAGLEEATRLREELENNKSTGRLTKDFGRQFTATDVKPNPGTGTVSSHVPTRWSEETGSTTQFLTCPDCGGTGAYRCGDANSGVTYDGNMLTHPTDAQAIRLLEKAGALIAAEIDRLLRLREPSASPSSADSGDDLGESRDAIVGFDRCLVTVGSGPLRCS